MSIRLTYTAGKGEAFLSGSASKGVPPICGAIAVTGAYELSTELLAVVID